MTSDLVHDASDGIATDTSQDAAPAEVRATRSGEGDRPSPWTVRVVVDGVEHRFAGVERLVIGASASCHVVVDDVPARPVHCEILLDGGWWLCARSPVRLAGQDVHGWVPVASGDRFEIGSHVLVVLFEEGVEQKESSVDLVAAKEDPRRRRWRPRSRPVVIGFCAVTALAAVSVAFLVDDGSDAQRVGASRRHAVTKEADKPRPVEPPSAVAGAAEAPVQSRVEPAVDRPLEPTGSVHVTQASRQAAHALLTGDYRVALQRYRVVAAAGDTTAALFVRALEQRVSASCLRTGRPPEECLR